MDREDVAEVGSAAVAASRRSRDRYRENREDDER